MYRILLVEDDPTIVSVLAQQLTKWNYQVEAVLDFGHVLEQFQAFEPHLVLMDISLPFFNGFYWCAEIRKISKTPVIFLSSAGDNMSLVIAINMGADDFLAKPFSLEVVLAKIQAILRRTYSFGNDPKTITHQGLTLNLNDATLRFGEETLELSKNEFKILQVLLEHTGCVVTREELIQKLWETDSFIDDNTLTVNMTRLRKRLESIGITDLILTKKGIGYLIKEEP